MHQEGQAKIEFDGLCTQKMKDGKGLPGDSERLAVLIAGLPAHRAGKLLGVQSYLIALEQPRQLLPTL